MRVGAWHIQVLAALMMAATAILLGSSGAAWAADLPTAAPSAAAAAAGDEGKEFHLNFEDIKDLKDADIVLPDLGEKPAPASSTQPDSAQPNSAQPNSVQPGSTQPNAAQPGAVQPGQVQPGAAQPSAIPAESGVTKIEVAKPADDGAANGEDEPEEPEINPQEVVQRIVTNMDKSSTLLSNEKDPGERTQTAQKEVIKDLDALIEFVKQQQSSQSQQQKQQQKQKQQDEQQQQKNQPPPKKGQPQTKQAGKPKPQQRGNQAAKESTATHGSVEESELAEVAKLLDERWGDLMPHDTRETLQGNQDLILQKYKELVYRYYYFLARPSAETGQEGGVGR